MVTAESLIKYLQQFPGDTVVALEVSWSKKRIVLCQFQYIKTKGGSPR